VSVQQGREKHLLIKDKELNADIEGVRPVDLKPDQQCAIIMGHDIVDRHGGVSHEGKIQFALTLRSRNLTDVCKDVTMPIDDAGRESPLHIVNWKHTPEDSGAGASPVCLP